MGAKLGRRFLKQPAEKLKAVFVAKNESNFIFSLKTQAENVNPRFSGAVWFSALYNIPPEPGYAVRQSFFLLLLSDHSGQYNRRRVNVREWY